MGGDLFDLFVSGDRIQKIFDQKELQIKMSLSVQCSIVEQFSFNDKKVKSVHVNGEVCFVSRDVYKEIGYEEENGEKTIQNLVPNKYKLRFGDVNPSLNQREDIFPLRKDTVLLKESGLYCFLSICKRDEAELFMEWAVEKVLPREVRKLASAIEEKDVAIALLNDEIKNCEYENMALQAQRDMYQAELEKCQDTITHLRTRYVDHARDPGKDNIIISVRKHTQHANEP